MASHDHSAHSEVHEHANELMKQSGQRYTIKRKEIVDAIAQFSQPVGIAELLSSVDDLPQIQVATHQAGTTGSEY